MEADPIIVGRKLREMRKAFAEGVPMEEIAEAVGVGPKTITDYWETGAHTPKFLDFFAYVKVLRRYALKKNFANEFETVWVDLLHTLFAEWPLNPTEGDMRTPGERAQDLVDYSKERDPFRLLRLQNVEKLISSLQTQLILPRPKVEQPNSWEFLPNKAFEISAVFPIEKDTITVQRRSAYRSPYLLTVDLRDQQYAIYSEKGKKLLRSTFVTNIRRPMLSQASAKMQDFLEELTDEGGDLSWRELTGGELVPLRWASAGILPVARLLKRGSKGTYESAGNWVVLFLRDIPPVGLNVGNGASESFEEFSSLEELIGREFAEELIVLKQRPKAGASVKQVVFYDRDGGRALAQSQEFLKFVECHQDLRKVHDGIEIEVDSFQRPRFLTPLSTPFAVRVMEAVGSVTRCRDVIFSLNPEELGIEVIRPYAFDLWDEEWLMDGEVLPSSRSRHPFLVRRPIILISVDFLREQYKSAKGLGEIQVGGEFLGGKQLKEIPAGAYKVFAEIDSRRARLQKVKGLLAELGANANEEQQALDSEQRLISGWLNVYEKVFEEALSGNKPLRAGHITTFCPVTFKTIELALRHQIAGFGI